MSLDIITPRLGKINKPVKDMIMGALTYEYPLSLSKLTNMIKKQYASSVTFQGVRRAVNSLVEDGVLVKQGKQYSISKIWITKLKKFADELHDSYFQKNFGVLKIESLGENIKIYTFDNLIDVDKFWNKIIFQWFKEDSGKAKYYVQKFRHMWPVLGQLGEETQILEDIKNYKLKFYTLVYANTRLDEWCKKYYADLGFYYNIDKKHETDITNYFSVYGDYIIQSSYPVALAKEIDHIYEKTTDFSSFNVADLIRVLRKKSEIQIMVQKNSLLANQLRQGILDNFRTH